MKRIASLALGSVFAMVLLAGAAHAQINSPAPALQGQPSYHLYSVPGVVEGGGVDTFFACTNTTSASIRVGIEIFGDFGGAAANNPSASSLEIFPGGSRLFGTGATVWVGVDSNVGGALGTGSARILATESKGIIWTAFLADPGNAPPTSMAPLTIVKKTKQKGD
ncbi:hypothetical protein L6Q96_08830 [Candidatus Binatia bacterium]|nr:hypothetical protein [Candidatus Binatia bacterium]